MVYDCHIHLGGQPDKALFKQQLEQAGVAGGIVFSRSAACFSNQKPSMDDAAKRIKEIIEFTKGNPNLYPFFWIDPTEEGAAEQVDMAAEAGIAGYKVICSHHYPQDDRAMKTYQLIATKGLPMLFHSGILYDNAPSGDHNRPCNFEHLFFIDGLRFAMAHISWPWCDELIAVYGKWNYLAMESRKLNSQLYVDMTPGTPAIYRDDPVGKLLTVDYPSLRDHMIFGTDGSSDYNVAMVKKFIAQDQFIYDKHNVPQAQRDKIFGQNLMAFLGVA